jgi:hypothetical protein
MNTDEAVRALEDLLVAESRSLAARLAEANPYLGWESGVDTLLVSQIIKDQRRHQERLAEVILALGGVPRAVPPDTRSARLHYVDAGYILPLLVEEERRLIALYDGAAPRVAKEPAASAVVARNRSSHAGHLQRLPGGQGGDQPAAGSTPSASQTSPASGDAP